MNRKNELLDLILSGIFIRIFRSFISPVVIIVLFVLILPELSTVMLTAILAGFIHSHLSIGTVSESLNLFMMIILLFEILIMNIIAIKSMSFIQIDMKPDEDGAGQMYAIVAVMFFSLIAAYSMIFYFYGLVRSGGGPGPSGIVDILYFSVMTWTTVGYGDIVPGNAFSKTVAGVEALNGYVVMAALVAVILKAFASSIIKAESEEAVVGAS